MKIGIFGFPMVGKTTLFNILTGAHTDTTKHAFTGKAEVHIGISRVYDPRLDTLSCMLKPKKTTFATLEFIDLGQIKREEEKESFLLNELKSVAALIHVVRGFHDETIPHSQKEISPAKDIRTMEAELILSDAIIAENRIHRLESSIKRSHKEEEIKELELVKKCYEFLQKEMPLRELPLSEEEEKKLKGFTFLSEKPLLNAINMDEKDIQKMGSYLDFHSLKDLNAKPKFLTVPFSAKIEAELLELPPEDATAFKSEYGITDSCHERVVNAVLRILDLITFFTVVGDETRGWLIKKGTHALRAAGTVHTDMERGFIKAEIVHYGDFIREGSFHYAKEKGLLRLEGKDYIVQDGDIINFKFNI
ncbi:MAG: DUF933 domain-containing protein [Acidobacteriota bacterium]